jgi:hypothetical protein
MILRLEFFVGSRDALGARQAIGASEEWIAERMAHQKVGSRQMESSSDP